MEVFGVVWREAASAKELKIFAGVGVVEGKLAEGEKRKR